MTNALIRSTEELDGGPGVLMALVRKKMVTADDVTALRRDVFADRPLNRIDIEALFTLDRVARPQGDAWSQFLVEVVTDHVVWDARPTGVVDTAQAEWLLRRVDASKTLSSFAILVAILDEAHRVPHWFHAAVRARAAAEWAGRDLASDRIAVPHAA